MKMAFPKTMVRLALMALTLVNTQGFAQLGEKADSLEQVAQKMKLTRKPAVTQTNYSLYELSDGNMTLREYVDKDGMVFAVAWDALSHPDLKMILASYFDDFSQSITHDGRPYGRPTQSEIRGEKVTVVKWGHMRSAHGKAYLQASLPKGFTADDIQ